MRLKTVALAAVAAAGARKAFYWSQRHYSAPTATGWEYSHFGLGTGRYSSAQDTRPPIS